MDDKYIEKIRVARIKLLLQHAFFGNMATRLILVCDNTMSTAATDGRHFFYNEQFLDKLSKEEMLFLFAHEVLHNVFEHHYRKGDRNHLMWNIACDYAVNLLLKDNNIGKPITIKKGGILMDEKYRGMSAEEIYDLVKEEVDKNQNLQELVDKLLDEHPDVTEGKTKEEIDEIRREMKEKLLSASQVSAGSVPAGVARYIKSFTEPKISWKDKIRQNITSILKSDYTFIRPNKKSQYSSGGFIFPGSLLTNAIEIVVSMDMSGSIGDDIAKEFLSEVNGILSQFDDYKIDIWTFDAEVYNHETFSSDSGNSLNDYVPKGGGGTIFECNWDYMKANDIMPKLFIMFTDMCPNQGWGDPDYCETLFVSRGSKGVVAPFGETIEMD